MHLSSAIILGSTLGELKPYDINSCALGMAGNTMGLPKALDLFFGDGIDSGTSQRQRTLDIFRIWPWLRCMDRHPEDTDGEKYTYARIIMAVFDHEVCNGKRTLENLVEYIRLVEPKCGECNYFNCQCNNFAVSGVKNYEFIEETVQA